MNFLNMTNNLYTMHFQNVYDITINLSVSDFFNNTKNYSWRTTEQNCRHDLFLFFFNIEKAEIDFKIQGLSGSCNYALARDSNKSKMVIYYKNPGRKCVTCSREIWTTFSILRVQTHPSLDSQPSAELGYNLEKDKNGCILCLDFNPICLYAW